MSGSKVTHHNATAQFEPRGYGVAGKGVQPSGVEQCTAEGAENAEKEEIAADQCKSDKKRSTAKDAKRAKTGLLATDERRRAQIRIGKANLNADDAWIGAAPGEWQQESKSPGLSRRAKEKVFAGGPYEDMQL